MFACSAREVCHAKVRGLEARSWDPETWEGDVWMDVHEDMGDMGSVNPQTLGVGRDVCSPLIRAPRCWKMLPKLLPDKATGIPRQDCSNLLPQVPGQ